MRLALISALVLLIATALVWALNRRDEAAIPDTPAPFVATPEQVQRGAVLARAGNCMGCHTARGGLAYAGGRAIDTPFGRVFAPNLTPDDTTGLGRWSADHFWRALHNGRSRDGRLLYPAFPYPNFTLVTRADSDALYAYLRSLAPVPQANLAHELRFPYNLQAALAVWRALYFTPGVYQPDAAQSPQWNRGSYLVRGLGHCNACHASRNLLGATSGELELSGGLIPMQNWYAPSLASAREAGVAGWRTDDVVQLLKTGVSPRGSVMGPMAEVVFRGTQHLPDADLSAMAVYLQALPQQAPQKQDEPEKADPAQMALGGRLYRDHCASCHGEQGQGAPGAYPPLAGNRGVTLESPANVLRAIVSGGFPPTTAGNPRPYGMPPFGPTLNDTEIAAVATYIRRSWGHEAPVVLPLQVLQIR
ncbi:cytochrome c [Ideonella sp. BN130291]|nr:cytochrome c [Ideonella sp. BN130291]